MELSPLQIALLLPAIAGIAFLYSSVGHGGATGYLAVMALLGIAPIAARPGALWMNCVVASIAFWRFRAAGHFDWRVFAPLAAASIPMAWVGSRMQLHGAVYAIVLGLGLAASGWLLGWARREDDGQATSAPSLPLALLAGGALGWLAGMTGIGGGVFLTPLLIFLRWTPAKTAGGVSSLFILVNSMAGLAGLGSAALTWHPMLILGPLVGAAEALAGTHFGVRRWSVVGFQRALAVVLWTAAGKLLLTARL